MAQVSLKNLDKIYPATRQNPAFHAVKSINLEIQDGEFMVLVGPSGCGKSTTLRMIAGLEDISDGTISIDQKEVNDSLPKDRGIAMVFQNYALYPHMSVYENMAFGLKRAKLPKDQIRKRVEEAAEILGLSNLLVRKPAALSGGQRQRVAVGRAIVRQPKVFLFDEPLSNLDAKMRLSMRSELSKLHARLRTTMIYVTHDQVEAMTMGDRICVMKDGEIMQVAEPLELYLRPANAYVASFMGSPPMNLIHGVIEHDSGKYVFSETENPPTAPRESPGARIRLVISESQGQQISKQIKRNEILLGIRPEDLSLRPQNAENSAALRLELAEPMGGETHLHLHSATHSLVARIPENLGFNVDDVIELSFPSAKLHFFDAQTQRSLSQPETR
jgi:multiple sugar transport system ATP-binding protein